MLNMMWELVFTHSLIKFLIFNISAFVYTSKEDVEAAHVAAREDFQGRWTLLQALKEDPIPLVKRALQLIGSEFINSTECLPRIGCGTMVEYRQFNFNDGSSIIALFEYNCCCRKGIGKIRDKHITACIAGSPLQ